MKIAVFLFACILTQMVGSPNVGPAPVQIAGQTHGRIAFTPGLPSFKPISRYIVAESLFTAIPVPDSFGVVYLCMGLDPDGRRRIIVLNTRSDSTSSIAKVSVQQLGGDTLFGTRELYLLPSNMSRFPLDMRIVAARHELIYRWRLAKEDPQSPGGLPTPYPEPISVGKPFPNIPVHILNGGARNLGLSQGRICVINWWWTRCSPCIAEMPGLNALVKKYKGRVDFIAVNSDPIDEVRAFLAKRTFNYQQTVVDTSSFAIFGRTAPRNIVLDKSGTVIFDIGGGRDDTYKEIEAVIQRYLSD